MKKLILSALAFFVFAAVTLAQDIPAADVAGSYSFLKVVKDSGLTAKAPVVRWHSTSTVGSGRSVILLFITPRL